MGIKPVVLAWMISVAPSIALAAAPMLVAGGVPQAEIVIAQNPHRSTRLAAHELRHYVEKISGARLPIVTEPSGNTGPSGNKVAIFVGESPHLAQRGITAKGLKYGAYRIVSGKNWLALVGDDTDFVPREPWARNNRDRSTGKLQSAWEKETGEPFGVPNGGMYKNRARLPGDLGKPEGATVGKDEELVIWTYDERGSYNAVCGYLRSLGVRWYMPGELGEVVPHREDLPLPRIDETIRPDFEVRQFNVRFGTVNDETMWWFARLGIRNPPGMMIAHGMHTMTQTDAVLRNHPDWFAQFGDKRDAARDSRRNHLCYSNEELFAATVRWARDQFDVYDFQTVSIMPPDAYIAICQCPRCAGKEAPEMGARGKLSNHVWDFVNRVAKEVGRTHPKQKIVCCAYGANTNPPTNIDKLEPNVQVVIVGGRRPRSSRPEQRPAIEQLRAGWLAKTDNPIMIFENYPITSRGFYFPAFTARTIGQSIQATKGISRGEDIWLSIGRDFDTRDVGLNHFLVYFTARMYWGGADQDVAALLHEYTRTFYGPAGPAMQEFFDYCEQNWQAMQHDAEVVNTALELFAMAQAKAPTDSVYAQRLARIDEFLETLRSKAQLLRQKRGPVPKLRMVWEPKEPIVVDGKLDDLYWRECPTSSVGRLRELQTGREPIFGTTIKAGWHQGSLYFAIRCDERPGEPPNSTTRKNEDQSIWYGDVVEIELDTDSHSYYQIAVNPAGAVVDLDRGAERRAWFGWASQAEVATHVADDHWTVELRIPVTDDDNDPLNQVVGRKPSQSLPWHFNVYRQRIRDTGSEYSAFSPTGAAGFHHPMKFAHLYNGRSHQFEVDPSVTDYIIASRAIEETLRRRKFDSAQAALVALAERAELTDFQRADALQRAAECARTRKEFAEADRLARRIPIAAVAKTVQMENLLAQRNWQAVVDKFAAEDFSTWPFWQVGAGAFARGKAYAALKDGAQAAADLKQARAFTSDRRLRQSILYALASNFEHTLEDEDQALATYQQIVHVTTNRGSATYMRAVIDAARILTARGEFEQALQTLDGVDAQQRRGHWRGALLLARGATLAAARQTNKARSLYTALAQDDLAEAAQRAEARRRLAALAP